MDDLETARRMGREGQIGLGLSVQEQGAYDQGRRERDRMLNPQVSQGGGGGGGLAILFLLALVAPAFAAPGLALWALWTHFEATQGWDWPVLAAICVGAAIAMIWLARIAWEKTPALVLSMLLSLYLGVSYALCMPMLMGTSVWWTAVIAMVAAAIGYWAGLNAPNRWMSSFLITTVAAAGLGVGLNVLAIDIAFPLGAPFYVAMAVKWTGAGLALGALLRVAVRSKYAVLGAVALVGLGLAFMPGVFGYLANLLLMPPAQTMIEVESY